MYYLLRIIYKPSENNYKQVRKLRPLLKKFMPLQRLVRK